MLVEEPRQNTQKEAPEREILVEKSWAGNARRKVLKRKYSLEEGPGREILPGEKSRVKSAHAKVYARPHARPSVPFSTRSAANHSGPNSHLYSIPNGLDRLSKIFTAVNFDISTTARPPSPRLGKLA